jgi:hypothetical protein
MQCFGNIEIVSMQERDWLLDLFDEDYEPTELISVLSAKYTPPTLQNTEGEPLWQCEAVLRPCRPGTVHRWIGRAVPRLRASSQRSLPA